MYEFETKEKQERALEHMAQVVNLYDFSPFRQSELRKVFYEMMFDYYNEYHKKYELKNTLK